MFFFQHSSCCFFVCNNFNVGSHDKVPSLPTNYNSGFFLSHVHCYPWRLTLLKFHPIILNDFTWKLKNFKIENVLSFVSVWPLNWVTDITRAMCNSSFFNYKNIFNCQFADEFCSHKKRIINNWLDAIILIALIKQIVKAGSRLTCTNVKYFIDSLL